ncbi:MAG: hypothetical protein EXX96DRAFT_561211 [Benjaminiella poitrasii]|nr:MAG: hypothetical protein EXX96DRAFT_561211 [Benjaminiella poitrasii]
MIHENDLFNPSQSTSNLPPEPTISYRRRHTEGAIPTRKYSSSGRRQRVNSSGESSTNSKDEDEDGKRKQFLERNRQAALKCRQRKKQWLANLQDRVEFLATDNEQLQCQATMLREEVLNLKTLLLAHRDCKVAQANGVTMEMIKNITASSMLPYNNNSNPPPSTTSGNGAIMAGNQNNMVMSNSLQQQLSSLSQQPQ